MENGKHQSGIDSVHDTSAFSCGLFVTIAAILAGAGLSLLPGMGMSPMVFPGAERIALACHGFRFFGCARHHAAESVGRNPADVGGVVCGGAPVFRIRCTSGVVCR